MKRTFTKICLLIFFVVMLLFPKEIFAGSSQGLLLWFQIVLPTLLPFMIISNLLIYTNSVVLINHVLSPLLCRFFNISKNSCFAVLVGFLCGYPMGAKVTADLVQTNRISLREGSYVLSFCNNTSPFFIISYVIIQNLHMSSNVFPLFAILICSPILASFLFRPFYIRKENTTFYHDTQKIQAPIMNFGFPIIDTCIMNSFETITKVGGYIILFSVAITCLSTLPILNAAWFIPILSSLEITNGIALLSESFPVSSIGFIAAMMLTSFGGFCAVMQTYSMIQPAKLSIKPYIIQKIITAFVTGAICYFYILIIGL